MRGIIEARSERAKEGKLGGEKGLVNLIGGTSEWGLFSLRNAFLNPSVFVPLRLCISKALKSKS